MRENDDLDILLDAALKTYTESEAGPSLEQRVLARIAAEPSVAPRLRWVPWAIALPLAACILLIVLFTSRQTPPRPNQVAHESSALSPLAALPAAPHAKPVHHTRARTPLKPSRLMQLADRIVPLPKLDAFPTPHPLNAEERTLTVIATQAPVPLRKAMAEAQAQADAPLHIAEIRIPPIQPPDQVQP